jgi:hypothetical protein
VSRFLFFLLLLAVLAFGAHLWLEEHAQRPDLSAREINPGAVRIVSVTPPTIAAKAVADRQRATQALAGAACVEFSGVAAADAARAHDAFAAMHLGNRLLEHPVEDVSRYWVFVPPAADRRGAEGTVTQLKRLGVGDVSIRPDNAISLGVFSSEEAARRFLASLAARGVRGAEVGPFTKEVRGVTMLVREPDTETVARLAILQRDFPGSSLHAVACPPANAKAGQ